MCKARYALKLNFEKSFWYLIYMGFINTMGDENVNAPNMGKKLENGTPIWNTKMQKIPRSIALMDVLL